MAASKRECVVELLAPDQRRGDLVKGCLVKQCHRLAKGLVEPFAIDFDCGRAHMSVVRSDNRNGLATAQWLEPLVHFAVPAAIRRHAEEAQPPMDGVPIRE